MRFSISNIIYLRSQIGLPDIWFFYDLLRDTLSKLFAEVHYNYVSHLLRRL